jgi:dolichol-phosphate mannosyltransferase
VRGLRAWCGGRQIGIPYDRPPRVAGTSGYPFLKLLNLAFDGMVSFSLVPLRFIFWLGLSSFLLAIFGLLFFLAHRIFAFQIFGHSPADVPGFTSLILAVLLMGGVQLLSLGVLGEYLGRIYLEVKNRPEYLVADLRPSLYSQPVAGQTVRAWAAVRS